MLLKSELDKQISYNIIKLRKSKGYSSRYTAKLLDIGWSTYIDIENTRWGLTAHTIYKICKVFNCESKDILGF